MRKKSNPWLYVVLIVTILALVGFSALPVVKSTLSLNQSLTQVNTSVTAAQTQLEERAKGYQSVLAREPNNNTALRGLLEIRLQQGDLQKAIAPLETLAQLNPEQTDYAILLAQAKEQIKDYQGAEITYRALLAKEPENMGALSGIVNLLNNLARFEDALALVKEQVEKNTENISLQLLLGQVYVGQKKYTDAIAVYDRALAADKTDFRPVLAKALVFKEQGKNMEAKPLVEEAVALAPPEYKKQIKGIFPD